VLVKALRDGFSAREYPIKFVERKYGKSKFSLIEPFRSLISVLRMYGEKENKRS